MPSMPSARDNVALLETIADVLADTAHFSDDFVSGCHGVLDAVHRVFLRDVVAVGQSACHFHVLSHEDAESETHYILAPQAST